MKLKEFIELNEASRKNASRWIIRNPSKDAIKKLSREFAKDGYPNNANNFRFIVTENGDYYVGPAYVILHHDLEKYAGDDVPGRRAGYIKIINDKVIGSPYMSSYKLPAKIRKIVDKVVKSYEP